MHSAPNVFSMLADDEVFEKMQRANKFMESEVRSTYTDYRDKANMINLKGLLQREYQYERDTYSVDKRILNLICDMGFAIHDQDLDGVQGVEVGATQYHRLVKRTPTHMIVVLYQIRKRIIASQGNLEDAADLAKRLNVNSFLGFMKKHGLVPPNTVGDERDHEESIKEQIEARRPKEETDPEEDITPFSISIINKRNQALCLGCATREGSIAIDKVNVIMEDGLR